MSYKNNIIGEVSVKVPLYRFDNVESIRYLEHCQSCEAMSDYPRDPSCTIFNGVSLSNGEKNIAYFEGDITIDINSANGVKMKNEYLCFDNPKSVEVYEQILSPNSAKVFIKIL